MGAIGQRAAVGGMKRHGSADFQVHVLMKHSCPVVRAVGRLLEPARRNAYAAVRVLNCIQLTLLAIGRYLALATAQNQLISTADFQPVIML